MKKIDLPIGIIALWLLAAVLLTIDTLGHATSAVGRWGVFMSAAAGTVTVCRSLRHVRRVILEVLTWERLMVQERETDIPENVRKIR